jgi:hypothetical protein
MRSSKWLLLLILTFRFAEAKAQVISGKVLADSTNKALAATVITHSGHQTSCNNSGDFTVQISGVGDTIKIFAIGYKSFYFPVKTISTKPIVIYLKQNAILLHDVIINAERNHKKDSLERRKDYSQIFNYQPPKVKDAFVAPPSDAPFAFVSVDLLMLLNSVTKNTDSKYKLKKLLLKDEQADYVATRFNRGLVSRTTDLKGDSLNTFMDKYYPIVDWVKKASDYDIILYIKDKAVEFRKTN